MNVQSLPRGLDGVRFWLTSGQQRVMNALNTHPDGILVRDLLDGIHCVRVTHRDSRAEFEQGLVQVVLDLNLARLIPAGWEKAIATGDRNQIAVLSSKVLEWEMCRSLELVLEWTILPFDGEEHEPTN